jgi:hypothetical protein
VHVKKVGESEGSRYIVDLVEMVQRRAQKEEKVRANGLKTDRKG